MKRSQIKRNAGLKPVSPKKRSRVGNLGIVRLVGWDLQTLRIECVVRDDYQCQECGVSVSLDEEEPARPRAEMAHIRTKRNNGDTLGNVRTLCPKCHRLEHAYGPGGLKPVPPK